MNYRKKGMHNRKRVAFGMMLVMIISLFGILPAPTVYAKEDKAERTIIYYCDGASSEETNLACSDMLTEALQAKFDSKKIRFIVMTGGSLKWHLDKKYLRDENGQETLNEISNEYNQVWELFGATDEHEGYMQLIDGDGVSGNGITSENELMNDPNTLKAFINFAKDCAPAEKYDLIMLDHGSGPGRGYGLDDHDVNHPDTKMLVHEIRQAISESDVVKDEGKFDMIFLECCMNGNFEFLLALEDYTDLFLGSPDVDPIESMDYTALLNYLNENPSVDTKILGKQMVDIFQQFYIDHPDKVSIGSTVQLTMVDTEKFKASEILNKMQVIADTLRSEATEKKFYDEIRSSQDDFRSAYSFLHDMGTLVEQLGINLKETDFQDPTLSNAYTETAIALQKILGNEDIIYSKHPDYSKIDDAIFGRNENGELEARGEITATSGLNIFFPYISRGDITEEVVDYIDAMDDFAKSLPDSDVKTFITTYRQAVIDYALIYEIGTAVSNIVDSEGYDEVVNIDKIQAYYESQVNDKWDSVKHIIDSCDRGEQWLNEIIGVMKNEVLNPKNVTVQKTDEDYLIIITNTPKRIIGVPELRLSAKTGPLPGVPEEDAWMYGNPTIVYTGQLAADAMEDVGSFEEFMTGNESAYRVPLFDGEWYAVQDSKGMKHVASIASDRSVYATFVLGDSSEKAGELYFDEEGNAKYIGLKGETKPIDLATYSSDVKVTLMNDPNSSSRFPISEQFVINGTDSKLIKAPYAELDIESIDAKLYISDIYGGEHAIQMTEATVMTAPEAKTGLVYTGSAQKLVTAGVATGGTMQYALGTNATTAPADSLYTTSIPTATNAGTYYVWYKVVSDENHDDSEAACVTVTISSRPSSGGGGSGGAAPATNPISVPTTYASAASHGKVSSSAANAKAGDKVTITPQPDEGYVTTGVTVTDAKGNNVPVTKNADGTYSFTMPATAVTVTPTFEKAGDQPAESGDVADRFTDVSKTAWYHDAVQWAVDKGIMNGVSEDAFAPDNDTTRAMVVTMLWRLAGEPASSAPAPFADVSGDAWYADAVAWAAETSAVNGTRSDTFSPNDPITREQLATILYRYAQAQGKGFTDAWAFPLDYPDAADVSEWANEAMHWMTMNGIITGMGDGTLAPQDNATRAQIATMFMRFVEAIEK